MIDNPLPVCGICERPIFSVDDPCSCNMHDNQTIAISLRHVAVMMERMSYVMASNAGFRIYEPGRLLLQHACEMQGASRMCIDLAENLENDT